MGEAIGISPRQSPSQLNPAATMVGARQDWVDLLRGGGIVLVVAGHAIGGLIDARTVDEPNWFHTLFAAIYVFHMPLFFFLAGLFVKKRLERGTEQFLRKQVPAILWPYVLWASLQIIVIWLASALVNNPGSGPGVIVKALLINPPSQFWFLYALLVMNVAAAAAGRRAGDPMLMLPTFALVALGEVHGMSGLPKAILLSLPWYATGVIFGPRIMAAAADLKRLGCWHWAIVAAAPVALILALWDAQHLAQPFGWRDQASAIALQVNGFRKFYAAAAIIAALVILAARFQHLAPRWLLVCGRYSMAILVVHVIVIAGTRIVVLRAMGTVDATALLILQIAVGMAAPLALRAVAARFGATRALGLG